MICASLLQPRIKRDLYSELDRGTRRRKPRAYADQSAQTPARRPGGHHARRWLPRIRQFRPRIYRIDRRAVVRLARLFIRSARQSRLRADAMSRLLSPLSPSLERTGDRAGGGATQNRAGADGPRAISVFGLGGERY